MGVYGYTIIFIVSGFWHGANWTFVIWGALNAIYFLPLLLRNKNRTNLGIVAEGKLLPSLKEISQLGVTFGLTCLAWVFFRSENVGQAFSYLGQIFSTSIFSIPAIKPLFLFELICLFILIEWFGRNDKFALEKTVLKWPKALRIAFYYSLILLVIFSNGSGDTFIYFQF